MREHDGNVRSQFLDHGGTLQYEIFFSHKTRPCLPHQTLAGDREANEKSKVFLLRSIHFLCNNGYQRDYANNFHSLAMYHLHA